MTVRNIDPELYIAVPYSLNAQGRCCQSRVIAVGSKDFPRVQRYLISQIDSAPSAYGILLLGYEWNGREYALQHREVFTTGYDKYSPELADQFENFPHTIQYYDRLNAEGLPFPEDEPVIDLPERRQKKPFDRRGRHSRKLRGPTRTRRKPALVRIGTPVNLVDMARGFSPGNKLRTPKSDISEKSPLYQSRREPRIAFPPRGCHPFIKHRVVSEAASKIPKGVQVKAFHVYGLCDFGDVPAATRRSNFLALKRRKGQVVGHYKFYRKPIAIITDMKTGIAYLGLHEEF